MKKYFLVLLLLACFAAAPVFAQTGLHAGDTAPAFTAKDNAGKTIDLKTLLKSYNSVVLVFYRGQWCPYCNKHLQQLQDSLQLLSAKKAYVVAVTPETNESIVKTIEKTHASFSIVHDDGSRIMKAYKVDYVLDDATVGKYKSNGLDLEANNGSKDHVLPVPATYIIDRSGKITFIHFNKDYSKRMPVSSILARL